MIYVLFTIQVTETELIKFVNSQVIEYKKIRGGIIFRDTIPRNNVGKLVRRKMREWAEQEAQADKA